MLLNYSMLISVILFKMDVSLEMLISVEFSYGCFNGHDKKRCSSGQPLAAR